jgi:riboflavin biosynthesis pyrimidine reductase
VVSPPNSLFIRRRRTAARLRLLTIGTPACGEEEDKGVNFPVNFLRLIHTGVDNLNLLAQKRFCYFVATLWLDFMGGSPVMQRLFPAASANQFDSLAQAYATPASANTAPWVILSMVQSVDGSTSLSGVSGPLGSEADQDVFSTLRSRADVLLVGAGTVRAEGYRPLKRKGQRLAIVSGSGALPWDEPVYTHDQTVIVAPEDGPDLPVRALRAGHGRVDLAKAITLLAPTVVLLEGGSSLNAQMLSLGLVDELCVTTAPVTVLGQGARIAQSAQESIQSFRLTQVLEQDGYLFSRYFRR